MNHGKKRILYLICTLAAIVSLLFPMLIWVLPPVLSTILYALLAPAGDRRGGYLSQIRTVCKIE